MVTIGFIVVRHINSNETNEYWKECYTCIRKFYPLNEIVIIDNDSNYKFVTTMDTVNTTIIQSEYKDMEFPPEIGCNVNDVSGNVVDADKLLMRSIKIDVPTLDKYVTRISTKKKEEIILPKQKDINLNDPEFKIKGLKKNNITNIYEDKNTKKAQIK